MTKARISQHASASGRITVDEVDLEGKYIRLTNKADEVIKSVRRLDFQTWFKITAMRLYNDKTDCSLTDNELNTNNIGVCYAG